MRQFNCDIVENKDAITYNQCGVGEMLRGNYRQASFYLLSAVVRDPEYWPAFFNLGNSWARLGENDAAIWAYEQSVRNCDDYAPLFLNLGILYCRQQSFRQALPYLEQSCRLEPEGLSQAVAMGYACYRLGEYGLSWQWYRKANRLDPANKKIRESLVLVGKKILATRD